ncbi:MAG: hypothetical protein RLZZ272_869 [Actinomycetota bacterium]
MEFTLAHGTGNDFVVVVDLDGRRPVGPALARALCDRRTGLGADGVLRIAPGGARADVTMDHTNADGSSSAMCGNGVRVVAKHVVDHGLVAAIDDTVRIATPSGVREVVVHRGTDGRVEAATVDMGPARTEPGAIPFVTADVDRAIHAVDLDGATVDVSVVSMGNPHAVTLVDDIADAAVGRIGSALETHERFPDRANIGFAEVVDRSRLRLRVWERGVGETSACGTGACAAAVATARLGLVDLGPAATVTVDLPGGTLTIGRRADGHLTLTGPAVEVAHGTLDAAWLAAIEAGA